MDQCGPLIIGDLMSGCVNICESVFVEAAKMFPATPWVLVATKFVNMFKKFRVDLPAKMQI